MRRTYHLRNLPEQVEAGGRKGSSHSMNLQGKVVGEMCSGAYLYSSLSSSLRGGVTIQSMGPRLGGLEVVVPRQPRRRMVTPGQDSGSSNGHPFLQKKVEIPGATRPH
jgi:hypothetical protein